jgi:hypothetical protein
LRELAKAGFANAGFEKPCQLVIGIKNRDAAAVTTLIKRRELTIVKGAMF